MRTVCLVFLGLGLCPLALAQSEVREEPKHLKAAIALVKKLNLKDTSYEHGTPKVKFSAPVEAHTDCSGFVDALLQYSYGYDDAQFKSWFGSKRPTAARYHDQVVDQNGFTSIPQIKDARIGDFLAVKYFNRKDNTGHVMLVSGTPRKIEARKPIVDGTEQWEVKVIDSSTTGHGATDTRHGKGADGKDHPGLGEGVPRLYADKFDKVAGFSWSELGASKFLQPKDEELVIGRLKPMFKP